MNGIVERKIGNSVILKIHNLSNELKDKIKELINYRLPNSKNKKVRVIGEILLNIIIREFTDMKIVSPFFNVEERNVKKGFDIIAVDSAGDLWIIESKAGEQGRLKSPTEKVCERIKVAKRDLDTRLNKDNSQLWLNAIKSVKCSLDENSEKKTIINILEKTSNSCLSTDKNVVLGGTVFCLFDSVIDSSKINNLYVSISKSNKFSKIRLIAIQKQTFQAVIDYLATLV